MMAEKEPKSDVVLVHVFALNSSTNSIEEEEGGEGSVAEDHFVDDNVGTLYPIPARTAKAALANQIVRHGAVLLLPDPVLGKRPYLAAVHRRTVQEEEEGEAAQEIRSWVPVHDDLALQSKQIHAVHSFHRVHPCHPALRDLPQPCPHVPGPPQFPISPLHPRVADIFGPVRNKHFTRNNTKRVTAGEGKERNGRRWIPIFYPII